MNLLQLQQRMAEDVCRPLTNDFQMQMHTEDGHSLQEIANGYVKPNASLSSFERLEIYNRQYWFRTISAVSEDYPTLEAILGTDRFNALVLAYLRETPSTSWNLRDLSAKLPVFLRNNPSLAGRRHRLAVDVASLEWAYIDAFDGQQLPAIAQEALQALTPASRLSLQPHLQLLALDYPVDELVLAVHQARPENELASNAAQNRSSRAQTKIPTPQRKRLYLAVHRFEGSVYYRRLERPAFLLLEALRAHASLQDAIAAAFKQARVTPDRQAEQVGNCFSLAAQLGWIAA